MYQIFFENYIMCNIGFAATRQYVLPRECIRIVGNMFITLLSLHIRNDMLISKSLDLDFILNHSYIGKKLNNIDFP